MPMEFGYIEILVAFVCLLLLWHCNKSSLVGATNWPVFGMLPALLVNVGHVHDYATRVLNQNGHTHWFKGPWFSGMDFVITSDPTDVQHILVRNSGNYTKTDKYSREVFEPLGGGLLNSDGDSWKLQQKMVQTFFKNKKFEPHLTRIYSQKIEKGLFPVLDLASRLGITLDMQDVIQRLTFDTVCTLILGTNLNCLSLELPEVSHAKTYDKMEYIILYRHLVPYSIWKFQKWLQIGEERKFSRILKSFDEYLYKCISIKREKLKEKGKTLANEEEFDLLTAFMVKDDNEAEGEEMVTHAISDKFLRDMAFNLLAAGNDTIRSVATWVLWLIATHPSVENKILKEIEEKLLEKENRRLRNFDPKELSKLIYLHATISEALRLYPSVPYERRHSIGPDILPSGVRVGKNTKILFCMYAMGRNEKIWGKDCLEFKPERWISEQGGLIHVPSHKFTTFGAGPRYCLGKNIAFIEFKMIFTSIIWNYHVRVVEGHLVSPASAVVLHLKHGLKVRVSKRHV